jgi:predicted ATP-dependent protease
MRNTTKVASFSQEAVQRLIESFNEEAEQITRLSAPLSNVSFISNEGDEN